MRLPLCYIAPQFSYIFRRAAEKLYRAYGAVMSALLAGYVLRPLGAKFRCDRPWRHIFIEECHRDESVVCGGSRLGSL